MNKIVRKDRSTRDKGTELQQKSETCGFISYIPPFESFSYVTILNKEQRRPWFTFAR